MRYKTHRGHLEVSRKRKYPDASELLEVIANVQREHGNHVEILGHQRMH
jgi:hypothetical protein